MRTASFVVVVALLSACERASAPAPSTAALFTSSDGLVAAPRPPGDGWECLEQSTAEATLIKCRQVDPSRFFFLMAKDYSVPPDQVRSPEDLVMTVFPATYQKLFTAHTITEAHAVTHAGAPGHEAWIDAAHASAGQIRKRERVITRGHRVFVLSAEGTPAVFDAEAAATEAWFSGARFKHL